jgi:hypothetical protein
MQAFDGGGLWWLTRRGEEEPSGWSPPGYYIDIMTDQLPALPAGGCFAVGLPRSVRAPACNHVN